MSGPQRNLRKEKALRRSLFLPVTLSAFLGGVQCFGAPAIKPANPHATLNARKVLNYLYQLPRRRIKRLVTGHLAGGSIGPYAWRRPESVRAMYNDPVVVNRGELEWRTAQADPLVPFLVYPVPRRPL